MDIEELRSYALNKPGAEECFPFGESALVFKVKGKMFLLISLYAEPLSLQHPYLDAPEAHLVAMIL